VLLGARTVVRPPGRVGQRSYRGTGCDNYRGKKVRTVLVGKKYGECEGQSVGNGQHHHGHYFVASIKM
jgi:hypothetical protein